MSSKTVENIYQDAKQNVNYADKLSQDEIKWVDIISKKCFNQKGVFTVLVTLLVYKIENPKQDIRLHRTEFENGFSGRSYDTKYITPTLKKLGLPSMAESGWLTRTLERSEPYTLDYSANIEKNTKDAFLSLIDRVQTHNQNPKYILVELFKKVIDIQKQNIIDIEPLRDPDTLTIDKIITLLDKQFSYNYHTSYGSKLPVIAFYSIYTILINELSRYSECIVKELGSHTASDRTSKSAGDIEIYKNNTLFESIEIKLDKEIDANILRIAKEKIIKYNPTRYYIFSYIGTKEEEKQEIQNIINEVKEEHGCQIIINGVIPTLKYYLRLIENLNEFFEIYLNLIQNDSELKNIHKEVFQDLVKELNNEI
jgi:DNA (cytosine-5)-methyltransferase 1